MLRRLLLLLLEGGVGPDSVVALGIIVTVRLVGSVRSKARVRSLLFVLEGVADELGKETARLTLLSFVVLLGRRGFSIESTRGHGRLGALLRR